MMVNNLWLVVTGTMEFYDCPFSWECHHPNRRAHIFQRGRSTTNQMADGWSISSTNKSTLIDLGYTAAERNLIGCILVLKQSSKTCSKHPSKPKMSSQTFGNFRGPSVVVMEWKDSPWLGLAPES